MPPEVDELFDEAGGDLALGELEAAAAKFAKCVEIAPDFFEGWHSLAMTRMKLGRIPLAIEAGLRAVELDPKDQLAWSSLSLCYVKNGQIPEAEAAAAKARVLGWGEQLKKPASPPPEPLRDKP